MDLFNHLIDIFCNIRADWEVKRRILSAIGKLVDALDLLEKVANCISDPAEIRKQEEEIRSLREEVGRLKAELLVMQDNLTATHEMAEETRKVAEQVKATFGETGTVVAKAKLFDERVQEKKKLSSTRIIWILTNFSEQVEATMMEARRAADRMEESSRMLTRATCTLNQLSDLSLPDLLLDATRMKGLEDKTPKSRNLERRTTSIGTPSLAIDLTLTPGSGEGDPVPNSQDGEWS